jgi:hypothetical protein
VLENYYLDNSKIASKMKMITLKYASVDEQNIVKSGKERNDNKSIARLYLLFQIRTIQQGSREKRNME